MARGEWPGPALRPSSSHRRATVRPGNYSEPVRSRDIGDGRSLRRPDLNRDALTPTEAPPGPVIDLAEALVTGGSLAEVRGDGEILRCALDSVDFAESRFHPLTLADVEMRDAEVSNAQWHDVTARRVELRSGRGVGLGLSLSLAWDLFVEDYRLDYAGIHIERVRGHAVFSGCSFREARIGGDLSRVVFQNCDFTNTQFEATAARDCDLRSSQLAGARGLSTLRGAVLDADQVIAVAGQLAAEAGLRIGE